MKFLVIDFPLPTSRGQCIDGFLTYGGNDWLGRQVVEGVDVCVGGGPVSRRFMSGSRTAWLSIVLSNRGRQRNSVDNVGLLVEVSLVKNGPYTTIFDFHQSSLLLIIMMMIIIIIIIITWL